MQLTLPDMSSAKVHATPEPLRQSLSFRSRCRIPIPLEPLKDGPSMDPKERTFLEAAERGDKHTMIRCLQPPNPVNVNCTNILGRSAIQIAVDNENVEIVELLLQQENVRIGDALLYAIGEGVYKIVEMLINHPSITTEMLANDWAKSRPVGEESSDYSPDISPIILAAHCNQFEILQLFLSRGATIEKPHSLACGCQKCREGLHTDSLRYSLRRIHTYRALASPAWISLTSEDPILTAFKLSWELERLALVENEFKDTYLELSEQCKKYSCDLLDQCRSTEEVIAVLNKTSDSDSDLEEEGDEEKLTLARLKLALKYEQKQFVAHPNCQQLLTSIWYEGLPVWRRRNGVVKILLCIGLILCLPLISVYYLLFPHSKLGQVLRSPFMKFLYHSTSFGLFLVLLVLASTRTESSERSRQNIRGPPPSFVECLIFFWVWGMVWAECKQLWEEGLKAYVRQWWNWLDFIMLSLYLATFSLRAVAYIQIQSEKYGQQVLNRAEWPKNDPTIIAEGIFAVANVFSFARIIYLFQTNPHLGPLQISLGCMIIDIAKFLFIFFLVLTSFACGLNQLYWYYDTNTYCRSKKVGDNVTVECQNNLDAFMTIDASYRSLLWSLFGVIPLKDLSERDDQAFIKLVGHSLLGAYLIMAMTVMVNMLIAMISRLDATYATLFWSLFGITSTKNTDLVEDHAFVETVGQGLYLAYHVGSIIVLINMLIAMMSNSFQIIEDHADREWKFARSKLWLSYFDEGSTLPAPFNLIVSPKSIYYFFCSCKEIVLKICARRGPTALRKSLGSGLKPNINGTANRKRKALVNYQEVMKRLVSRYIHQIKKQLRQDGVNEDDLLEIKQDISSLRYELREDRKREAARCTGHIDSIKRDIIRSLRGSGWSANSGSLTPGMGQDPTLYSPGSKLPYPAAQGSLLSTEELEYLKREIVVCLRSELREMLREVIQPAVPPSLNPPAPPPPGLPAVNSELYQTHLYTQL